MFHQNILLVKLVKTMLFINTSYGGGIQIWFGRESAAQALKPLPMFEDHFGRKGIHS